MGMPSFLGANQRFSKPLSATRSVGSLSYIARPPPASRSRVLASPAFAAAGKPIKWEAIPNGPGVWGRFFYWDLIEFDFLSEKCIAGLIIKLVGIATYDIKDSSCRGLELNGILNRKRGK